MKSLVLFTLILSTSAIAGIGDLPKGAYLMVPSQGYELTHQCSSQSYQADDYWIPSSIRVVILEARLHTYLKKHPMETAIRVPLLPLSKWHRQYIGFTRFGRKYLYGIFYPPSKTDKDYDDTPVNVCDWGQSWGVLFDDVTATVKSVDLTGCLCGPPPVKVPKGADGYFPSAPVPGGQLKFKRIALPLDKKTKQKNDQSPPEKNHHTLP
ncbi:MAG: hypothetical protein ACRETC_08560 [Gammaproteobacteria bacterium]